VTISAAPDTQRTCAPMVAADTIPARCNASCNAAAAMEKSSHITK
jgi:hypothetical protein